MSNAIIITQIALDLATRLQSIIATQAQANAEGREVSDVEVAAAREQAESSLASLQAAIDAKRSP